MKSNRTNKAWQPPAPKRARPKHTDASAAAAYERIEAATAPAPPAVQVTIRELLGFVLELTGRVPVRAACFTLAAQIEGYRESAGATWMVAVNGTTVSVSADHDSMAAALAAIERACTALHYSINGSRLIRAITVWNQDASPVGTSSRSKAVLEAAGLIVFEGEPVATWRVTEAGKAAGLVAR